ncbi:MAG: acetate--CoA ligase family protein [Patescibacteria group bacterium]
MLLNFKESQEILQRYDIPLLKTTPVKNHEELSEVLKSINFPIVMKVDSKEIAHKTEVGGVVTDIKNEEEAFMAMEELMKIESGGVLVQEQTEGEEVIIGGKRDKCFGPVVMVGLGGITVEIYKDIVFRLAPMEKQEALEMLEEIKGKKILEGFRGRPPINKDSLADILVKTSHLLKEEDSIQELDFNPVLSGGYSSLVCDVKLIL